MHQGAVQLVNIRRFFDPTHLMFQPIENKKDLAQLRRVLIESSLPASFRGLVFILDFDGG